MCIASPGDGIARNDPAKEMALQENTLCSLDQKEAARNHFNVLHFEEPHS